VLNDSYECWRIQSKNSKKIILGFSFNKKTFELEQELHQKPSVLQIIKLKTLFIKEFWWEKNWDDVNWLSTL
jgi:hypothetical protein